MFITFYGRDFKSLTNNSSLNIGSYKLVRRSYDLNEFSGDCEPISLDIEPMFATMKYNDGTHYYDMLRPIITKDKNGKGHIVARDLFGVLNTECFIDFTTFTGESVKEYLSFIFNQFKQWDVSGFERINLILSFPDKDLLAYSNVVVMPKEKGIYNIKELFSKALLLYDLYLDSYINMHEKSLDFTVKPSNANTFNIRLEDFGIDNFGKYEPDINTAIVYAERGGLQTIRHNWFLLQSGVSTSNSELRDIYPVSTKVFYIDGQEIDEKNGTAEENDAEFARAVNNADFEAVCELAENRYQETIEIETVKDLGRLNNIYFDTNFKVFYQNKEYKTLPLGEIEENGTNNKKLRIGFKPIDFIQVV